MKHALASMTGFARSEGATGGVAWSWELRSVNGRGLDLRFRLPPGFDTLEPTLREAAATHLKRGNVTANLTVKQEDQSKLAADPAALEAVLALALALTARIPNAPPPNATSLLALPGVLRPAAASQTEEAAAAQSKAAAAGFTEALAALRSARQSEGARLAEIVERQLAEITALCETAKAQAADQPALQQARMLESVKNLLQSALPADRIAQEVALLASRSDVREELDRLDAHLHAAQALLSEAENIGRRFDFLVQEFNREANTLCSKSASIPLTATGLKLKAAIEQLREQVQNVE